MLKKIIISVMAVILLVCAIVFNSLKVNTKQVAIREETLYSDKIDDDLDGLLIAYFSDLDYGDLIKEDLLGKACDTIRAFDPDVIIFGGDLSSDFSALTQEETDQLSLYLRSLQARYGKFAVTGELDNDRALSLLSECDFLILSNMSRTISIDRNSRFNIVGLENMISGRPDPDQAFEGVDSDTYTLVVTHCPDTFDLIRERPFEYMLAGHSRGGQIYLPLISLFMRQTGCENYYHGKTYKDGHTLDISNGIGRIDHDARFLADGEVVFYTLRKKS